MSNRPLTRPATASSTGNHRQASSTLSSSRTPSKSASAKQTAPSSSSSSSSFSIINNVAPGSPFILDSPEDQMYHVMLKFCATLMEKRQQGGPSTTNTRGVETSRRFPTPPTPRGGKNSGGAVVSNPVTGGNQHVHWGEKDCDEDGVYEDTGAGGSAASSSCSEEEGGHHHHHHHGKKKTIILLQKQTRLKEIVMQCMELCKSTGCTTANTKAKEEEGNDGGKCSQKDASVNTQSWPAPNQYEGQQLVTTLTNSRQKALADLSFVQTTNITLRNEISMLKRKLEASGLMVNLARQILAKQDPSIQSAFHLPSSSTTTASSKEEERRLHLPLPVPLPLSKKTSNAETPSPPSVDLKLYVQLLEQALQLHPSAEGKPAKPTALPSAQQLTQCLEQQWLAEKEFCNALRPVIVMPWMHPRWKKEEGESSCPAVVKNGMMEKLDPQQQRREQHYHPLAEDSYALLSQQHHEIVAVDHHEDMMGMMAREQIPEQPTILHSTMTPIKQHFEEEEDVERGKSVGLDDDKNLTTLEAAKRHLVQKTADAEKAEMIAQKAVMASLESEVQRLRSERDERLRQASDQHNKLVSELEDARERMDETSQEWAERSKELNRLRTLMRFSQLKRDSDKLQETYQRVDELESLLRKYQLQEHSQKIDREDYRRLRLLEAHCRAILERAQQDPTCSATLYKIPQYLLPSAAGMLTGGKQQTATLTKSNKVVNTESDDTEGQNDNKGSKQHRHRHHSEQHVDASHTNAGDQQQPRQSADATTSASQRSKDSESSSKAKVDPVNVASSMIKPNTSPRSIREQVDSYFRPTHPHTQEKENTSSASSLSRPSTASTSGHRTTTRKFTNGDSLSFPSGQESDISQRMQAYLEKKERQRRLQDQPSTNTTTGGPSTSSSVVEQEHPSLSPKKVSNSTISASSATGAAAMTTMKSLQQRLQRIGSAPSHRRGDPNSGIRSSSSGYYAGSAIKVASARGGGGVDCSSSIHQNNNASYNNHTTSLNSDAKTTSAKSTSKSVEEQPKAYSFIGGRMVPFFKTKGGALKL